MDKDLTKEYARIKNYVKEIANKEFSGYRLSLTDVRAIRECSEEEWEMIGLAFLYGFEKCRRMMSKKKQCVTEQAVSV